MDKNETQAARSIAFKQLHDRQEIFVIPNPWDAGSAKMLAWLGFEALATTSAGLAFMLGKPDGEGIVTLEDALENAKAIVDATSLPVSGDLENGYGDEPENCAETIRQAGGIGLCGGSIEDTSHAGARSTYPFAFAVERVSAAVQAARSLPHYFVLSARAESKVDEPAQLKDVIDRLVAFAGAGADVLFAPQLKTRSQILTAVKAVTPRPLNVVMGLGNAMHSLQELADMGVRRISVGSSFARAAYGEFLRAAQVIKNEGVFDFKPQPFSYADFNSLFRSGRMKAPN